MLLPGCSGFFGILRVTHTHTKCHCAAALCCAQPLCAVCCGAHASCTCCVLRCTTWPLLLPLFNCRRTPFAHSLSAMFPLRPGNGHQHLHQICRAACASCCSWFGEGQHHRLQQSQRMDPSAWRGEATARALIHDPRNHTCLGFMAERTYAVCAHMQYVITHMPG